MSGKRMEENECVYRYTIHMYIIIIYIYIYIHVYINKIICKYVQVFFQSVDQI